VKMTDWRGNEYDTGSLIVYPAMSGRSCEIVEAVVVEVYGVVRNEKTYGQRRAADGEQPKSIRARVQPTGRGSRRFYRSTERTDWIDDEGNVVPSGEWRPGLTMRRTPTSPRAVTLTILDNITVVSPRS
jgi:hypothetical protein